MAFIICTGRERWGLTGADNADYRVSSEGFFNGVLYASFYHALQYERLGFDLIGGKSGASITFLGSPIPILSLPIKSDSSLLNEIFEESGDILFAYLFGSCARGDAFPSSDIDVAVFLDQKEVSFYQKRDDISLF